MTASPALHQAAVHPHKPAPFLPALAGRSVLRRQPARAFGVIRSVGWVLRPAEIPQFGGVSSLDLRAALPGAARLFATLFRARSGASLSSAFVPAINPISQTGA